MSEFQPTSVVQESPPPPEAEDTLLAEQHQSLERAAAFLRDTVPIISKLTGLNVHVEVGKGWATNMKTGDFTVDPSFFLKKSYSADHCVYATLHELMAHVRDVVRDPVCAQRQMRFCETPNQQLIAARAIFNNILSDILGNKRIHDLLPDMRRVAHNLYKTRLFPPETPDTPADFLHLPMHLQFLYKIIRQEMIDGSETIVRPEVDDAISALRNFQNTGLDAISYLTDPGAKDAKGNALPGAERFDQQVTIIYPVYEALLEQDKEEAKQRQSEQDQDDQGSQGDQYSASSEQNQGEQSDNPFTDAYADYFENKHPEPLDKASHEDIHDAIEKAAEKDWRNNATPEQRARRDQYKLNKQFHAETGHSLQEQHDYRQIIELYRSSIDDMRQVFASILNEVTAKRRGLSRRAYTDGDILHPDRLVQTYIDTRSNIPEPDAYQRYERVTGRTELACKTDYFFVFDTSDSMAGQPAEQAAISAVIMLEALASMERDIRCKEREESLDLKGLQIRTALYVFGNDARKLKELSPGLDEKQRLDAFSAVAAADGGGTADFLALEEIAALPPDRDRQRVIVVVSDGESNDPHRTAAAIHQLRQQGAFVYGVAIGSPAAEQLYAPNATLIKDPTELPKTMQTFIEGTMR